MQHLEKEKGHEMLTGIVVSFDGSGDGIKFRRGIPRDWEADRSRKEGALDEEGVGNSGEDFIGKRRERKARGGLRRLKTSDEITGD